MPQSVIVVYDCAYALFPLLHSIMVYTSSGVDPEGRGILGALSPATI